MPAYVVVQVSVNDPAPYERYKLLAPLSITKHGGPYYEWVLVRLSRVRAAELRDRLEDAWRRVAPKALLAAFGTERRS